MTPKENLLAALAHREPAWIPWLPNIGGANTPVFVPEAIKRKHDDVELAFFMREELGCDVFLCSWSGAKQENPSVKTETRRENDLLITEQEIAGRRLRKVVRKIFNGEHESSVITEYPVKDPRDMETLEWLVEDSRTAGMDEAFTTMQCRVGEVGLVAPLVPATPIMRLIVSEMGLENFVFAWTDHRDKVERLLQKLHAQNMDYCRTVASSNCEAILSINDFSTRLLSPGLFEQYAVPALRDYTTICHATGKLYIDHACGHICEFLESYRHTGIDALHFLTPPPTGNTPFKVAREIWGEQITIMGAIDPVLLMQDSAQEVERLAHQMFDDVGSSRSFVFMSPSKPDIPEENIRILAKVAKEHRRVLRH
jgi:uroporphyrinogen-III decarboxylase